MPTFRLNKLIKDSVYDYMLDKGQKPKIRILKDDAEFEKELLRKLQEELDELTKTDDPAKELKDILAVIRQIAMLKNLDLDIDFKSQAGLFDRRVYVSDLVLSANDPWVKYYRQEPNRFEEITK